jgi:amino acid transporter
VDETRQQEGRGRGGRRPSFLFPGEGGGHHVVDASKSELATIREELNKPKRLLSQWPATAICGNDVMSSCTYSPGIVAKFAGPLSPVAFFIVAIVLYMFRFVYTEVVSSIPLNGGSYNVLLNTTAKRFAAFASCFSTLCYIATSVVSATAAAEYLKVVVLKCCMFYHILSLMYDYGKFCGPA